MGTDGQTNTTELTNAFRNFEMRPKKKSINCNKARYWTIGILFPIGAGILFFFVAASRPHPADQSHLLIAKHF